MKELISRPQADALIVVLGVLGIIVAVAAALIARRRGENAVKFATLFGGPLLLCAALWPVYNAIEDHFGLDSVVALAINGVLFVAIGAAVGFGWTARFGKSRSADTE